MIGTHRNRHGSFLVLALGTLVLCAPALARVTWIRKSTTTGDLPAPNSGQQQTCCVVFDIDGDGIDDFVIGERTRTPSVVWYKYNGKGWNRYVIDDTPLRPEAGGAAYDIDGDGDLDLVLGQDASGNAIWWWENPAPDFRKPWTRRLIKNTGGRKHHDQTFGDFTGAGRAQFVTWNQGDKRLLLYGIPSDPKGSEPWPSTTIYQWTTGREREGFPSLPADIDGDGKLDILLNGGTKKAAIDRWQRHHIADLPARAMFVQAGDLNGDGRPDLIAGGWWWENPGTLGGKWKQHTIGEPLRNMAAVYDFDGDTHLDIVGTQGVGSQKNSSFVWARNDGKGNFTIHDSIGYAGGGDFLEGCIVGDLDVISIGWYNPKLWIFENLGTGGK